MRSALSFILIIMCALALMPPALSNGTLNVSIAKAPVAPDGTTAGAVADFVITLVDRNPAVAGIGLKTGGSVEVILPEDFVNTGAGGDVVIILQGWPQSPRVPFPFTTSILGNTITLTLTDDWAAPGPFGPGPKQIHLIGRSFDNPEPGRYPISVSIQPDPNSGAVLSGVGFVQIIPRARPSVNVVSIFSGQPPPPPFPNPFYQTIDQGDPSLPFGLYLWDKDSEPFLGVDLEMTNSTHGRLIDVVRGKTVGQVWIHAPAGSTDFELSTSGPSILDNAFATGLPVGRSIFQLWPDPTVTGNYAVTISTNNGNEETLLITVVPD